MSIGCDASALPCARRTDYVMLCIILDVRALGQCLLLTVGAWFFRCRDPCVAVVVRWLMCSGSLAAS